MRWQGPAALYMTKPSSHQRGCYVRTMTAGVQLRIKILDVSLKELGAKMN
jgi:hypothetical protein